MKGCTDYTQEARNWVRPPQKRRGLKNAVLLLLGVVITVSVVSAILPGKPEETFTITNAKEVGAAQGDTGTEAEQNGQVALPVLKAEEKPRLVVYITGAVINPGVYELCEGDRLNDAVLLAGGLAEGSAANYVNLAASLQDGTHIHIPFISEVESGEAAQIYAVGALGGFEARESAEPADSQKSKLVNINTATLSELETLPGIGAVMGQRIIDYRNKYGAFKSIEDLKNVSGIGDKKFEDLADKVCI